jgi:hypothetical protein
MCRENGKNDRLFCLEERVKLPVLDFTEFHPDTNKLQRFVG